MASLVLGTVGRIFGGPIGGLIGAAAGSLIDNALFTPTIRTEGPRLSDLSVQTSTYGSAVPRLYGPENRIAGNVIWSSGLRETKTTERSGGKGTGGAKTSTTSYTYAVDVALALCAGPISGVGRIWADSKIFREADGTQKQATAVRIYTGTETQLPDSLIQAAVGVANTPAHRGMAYVVIENLQLADFGNRLPFLQFEVIAQDACTVETIITDLCAVSGLADVDAADCAEFNVRGFAIGRQSSARDALQPLREAFLFDAVEDRGLLRFGPSDGAPVANIKAGSLAAHLTGTERPNVYEAARTGPAELPREIVVSHSDPARDYQTNSQRARRQTGAATASTTLEMPLVMDAADAKLLAERSLATAWSRRTRFTVSLPLRWMTLEPGSKPLLPLDNGKVRAARIVRKTLRFPQTVELECEADGVATVPSSAAAAITPVPPQEVQLPGVANYALMDIPLLRDADDGPGFYAAAAGFQAGYIGASLFRSTDGGVNYDRFQELAEIATLGTASTALVANADPELWDERSVVTVALLRADDTLSSVTTDDVLNGANAALIGDEVVQFRTATLTAPQTYQLSGFLRGRKGTEERISAAAAGVRFVLLSGAGIVRTPQTLADIGVPRSWKAVSIGTEVAAAVAFPFTDAGRSLQPLAPVLLAGTRNGGGDLAISWVRRTRLDASWRDNVDAPVGEDAESYQVDIMNGGTVVRTIASTTPAATYLATEQVADFGSAQASIAIRIYQMSARIGRGLQAGATL
jgi:hypothetical protein